MAAAALYTFSTSLSLIPIPRFQGIPLLPRRSPVLELVHALQPPPPPLTYHSSLTFVSLSLTLSDKKKLNYYYYNYFSPAKDKLGLALFHHFFLGFDLLACLHSHHPHTQYLHPITQTALAPRPLAATTLSNQCIHPTLVLESHHHKLLIFLLAHLASLLLLARTLQRPHKSRVYATSLDDLK